MEGEDWVAEETAHPKNSRVGKLSGPRERTKRDFSTAQIETFAEQRPKKKRRSVSVEMTSFGRFEVA
jgi:hypothetical protein